MSGHRVSEGSVARESQADEDVSSSRAISHLTSFEEGVAMFSESKSGLSEQQLMTVLEVSPPIKNSLISTLVTHLTTTFYHLTSYGLSLSHTPTYPHTSTHIHTHTDPIAPQDPRAIPGKPTERILGNGV